MEERQAWSRRAIILTAAVLILWTVIATVLLKRNPAWNDAVLSVGTLLLFIATTVAAVAAVRSAISSDEAAKASKVAAAESELTAKRAFQALALHYQPTQVDGTLHRPSLDQRPDGQYPWANDELRGRDELFLRWITIRPEKMYTAVVKWLDADGLPHQAPVPQTEEPFVVLEGATATAEPIPNADPFGPTTTLITTLRELVIDLHDHQTNTHWRAFLPHTDLDIASFQVGVASFQAKSIEPVW